jgi:hypothetical protein
VLDFPLSRRPSRNLEATADPVVSIATFGHPGTDEFAEQALEGIAGLWMVGRGVPRFSAAKGSTSPLE